MDPFQRSERRRQAQRRLWAKRRRIGLLRSRVVAISLIGFALLWGVVFAQMATGNDPVLGSGTKNAARDREGRSSARDDRGESGSTGAAAGAAKESREATEPEAETEYIEPEPEYVEPEPEYVEPEPEYFEPEPVETAQS